MWEDKGVDGGEEMIWWGREEGKYTRKVVAREGQGMRQQEGEDPEGKLREEERTGEILERIIERGAKGSRCEGEMVKKGIGSEL